MTSAHTHTHTHGGQLIILGGGIAALTTAFYASEPDHEQVFPGGIHVYEMTDVLGGKGASRRGSPDHAVQNRIEEHGLHVWFGSYDNAFALLAGCQDYLNREQRKGYKRWGTAMRDISQGFRPCSRVAAMDFEGGAWLPWVADFPEDSSERPWDPRRENEDFASPAMLVARALRLAESFLYSITGRASASDLAHATLLDPAILPIPMRVPNTAPLSAVLGRALAASTSSVGSVTLMSQLLRVLAFASTQVRARFDEPVREHAGLRRGWQLVDLLLAAVRGLIDDGVVSTGKIALIDGIDLRGWLVLHGASEESVSCGLLKALVYDLAFAYQDGDPDKPSCSAASGVYGLFRLLLTYRGAVMWKMNAGMGEIVFAPIYEALLRRGVHFHFGQEVKSIQLEASGERPRVKEITFAKRPVQGREGKQPLPTVTVEDGPLAGELPHWGSEPPAEWKAAEGKLDRLRIGGHDMIVYGLPVGTIAGIVQHPPESWQRCARELKTTSTAAVQLWLNVPVIRYAPWASPDITVGAYTEPFDTWADMAVLSGETLAGASHVPPESVAYFTNVAPSGFDSSKPAEKASLDAWVGRFLDKGLGGLWPTYDTGFVIDKYVRFNCDATSRYTLSLPGTLAARLSPDDASIRNLRPAGDWTRNIINAGCIEAAVISGMMAARALRPDRELRIVGE